MKNMHTSQQAFSIIESCTDLVEGQLTRLARDVGAYRGYWEADAFRVYVKHKIVSRSPEPVVRMTVEDWGDRQYHVNIPLRYLDMDAETIVAEEKTRPPQFEWNKRTADAASGDLMTVEEWKDSVRAGGFIDYDGHGSWLKFVDGVEHVWIATRDNIGDIPEDAYPSDYTRYMPEGATHIRWYNR